MKDTLLKDVLFYQFFLINAEILSLKDFLQKNLNYMDIGGTITID
jgi:hypothetical protein